MRAKKCAYYILKWQQQHNGTMKLINATDTPISIKCDTDHRKQTEQKIQQLHADQPFKYVGITTAPDGNLSHSINALKKICYEFKNNINKTQFQPPLYDIALHHIFLPRLQYQITAYTIKPKEYKELQKYMSRQ